jgi:hypothetical protein
LNDFGESFEERGWRIECFVNNNESTLKHFKADKDKGRPKKFDLGLSTKYFEALSYYYQHNEKQPWIEFVNEIYEPLGGQLFAGFVMDKNR